MKMEDILLANFGEKSSKIKVGFKKTIQIEQYNPEIVQAEVEVEFDGSMSGIERDVIANVMQNSIEFEAISHLFKKGLITKDEFTASKLKLEDSSEAMLRKYETLTGKDRAEILNLAK